MNNRINMESDDPDGQQELAGSISYDNNNNFFAASDNKSQIDFDTVSYADTALDLKSSSSSSDKQKSKISVASSTTSRITNDNIELQKKIKLIEYTQKPYHDVNLKRFEGAVRRSWAVQTSISVREHNVFVEKSEIVIELSNSYAHDLSETQKQELIQDVMDKTKDTEHDLKKLIQNIIMRDDILKLEPKLRTLYWQCLEYGNGAILKVLYDENDKFKKDDTIKKLLTINSRRLGNLIHDRKNDMSFEGAYIDGQPLDRTSMIYAAYQEHDLSPHTANYGYTPLDSVLNLAEGLSIFYEEDVKEIQRSAWLSSILLMINTAGLTAQKAAARIKSIIKAIEPGKIIGIGGQGESGVQAQPIELKSDLGGLAELSENQEAKVFKAFRVPQFLVQSEDIANRATADKAAELFLSGVIAADQRWLSDILEEQWYEPYVRTYLNITDDKPLPIRIRRQFKLPTVSEFIDLADGLTKLTGAGIWDTEQANETLKTPEVGDRIASEQLEMEEENNNMIMNDPNMTDDKNNNKNTGSSPNNPNNPNGPSRPGNPKNSNSNPNSPKNSKSKKKKEEAYASITTALNIK